MGASLDELLAGAPASGTISDELLTAQGADQGTLGDTPPKAPTRETTGSSSTSGSSSSGTRAVATASADTLPFTGSDPRITLLLGAAALLAGAGLRLRTGDARDF